MKKVFWDDPYQTSLNTTIADINGDWILLQETIAFSFSGGQESDKAFINEDKVLESRIDNQLIYYRVESPHHFQKGDHVVVKIDWQRRYRLMRLHFAAELILELVTRKLKVEKIGAHIAESKARIDFYYDQNISAIFDDILKEYNNIIQKDLLINTGYTDKVKQRRFWEIDGFSKVACGGTHVKSTAEVGYVTLKRKNIGGSKERIEIRLTDQG